MNMSARFAETRFWREGRSVERYWAAGGPRVLPERVREVRVAE